MREIVHVQAGQCGNQIGAKVIICNLNNLREKKEKGLERFACSLYLKTGI